MNEAGEQSDILGAYCHRDSGLSLGADMLNQRVAGRRRALLAMHLGPALIEEHCAALVRVTIIQRNM